jgi:hypothetical protein
MNNNVVFFDGISGLHEEALKEGEAIGIGGGDLWHQKQE